MLMRFCVYIFVYFLSKTCESTKNGPDLPYVIKHFANAHKVSKISIYL